MADKSFSEIHYCLWLTKGFLQIQLFVGCLNYEDAIIVSDMKYDYITHDFYSRFVVCNKHIIIDRSQE